MINLFSDTATRPTPPMLSAMTQAPLGDEQRRDDPTVNQLEARTAELLGKEAAVLMPTATMANQVAISLLAPPGSELLCHESAHVYNFEGGGAAANAGVQVRALPGERGIFDSQAMRDALSIPDPHCAPTRLVVVENTSNHGGGSVWPDDAFFGVSEACREFGLNLHLDGARLFNAAVKRDLSVAHWSMRVDTVQLCFSKGLGCPFGAVLAGTAADMERARFVKQRLGGALRQAGVLAGAMLYALDHHITRLADDHARLERIAQALAESASFRLWPHETNILYFQPLSSDPTRFAERLRQAGVLVSRIGNRLRICTHLGVGDSDVERAIELILDTAKGPA